MYEVFPISHEALSIPHEEIEFFLMRFSQPHEKSEKPHTKSHEVLMRNS